MTRLLPLLVAAAAVPVHAATIAHYKFETLETNAPLTLLIDSSGRGHHGQVLGREAFEVTTDTPPHPALTRTALDARGRNDHGIIPHHADFAPSGAWTIEFFFKPSRLHQDFGGVTNVAGIYTYLNTNLSYTVLAKHNTNQPTIFGSAWAFHYQPAISSIIFTLSYGTNRGVTLRGSSDLNDGEWHHVAVVYRTNIEDEVSIYVDGWSGNSVNQHGGNIPIAFGDGPITVGAWAGQDNFYTVEDRNFDGMIDELRFSDAALTPDQFTADVSPVYNPVDAELYLADEIQFATETNVVYRIEQITAGSPSQVVGHVLGDGGSKSFFRRRDGNSSSGYRVLMESDPTAAPLVFDLFNAVELRFPTDPAQLYVIHWREYFGGPATELTFILGDGAKHSLYDRMNPGQSRFYEVERY